MRLTNQQKQLIQLVFFVLFCFLFAVKVQAASNTEYQPPIIIEDEIEYFLDQQKFDTTYPIQFKIRRLDQSLKLKKCQGNLSSEYAGRQNNFNNTLIRVRCKNPEWSITLPVRISIFKDILVLNKATPKNTILSKDQVSLKKINIAKLKRGFFESYSEIEQLQLKQSLAAKTILKPSQFKKLLMVKIGQIVTIENNSNFIHIKMSGKSLNNGGYGDIIKVKNLSSGKIIQATVKKNGLVKALP